MSLDEYKKHLGLANSITTIREVFAEFGERFGREYRVVETYGCDDAEIILEGEMIAMEPENPGNYQALGTLYEGQGMYEEAEAEFLKAVEINPSDPLGYQVPAARRR